MIFFYVDESGTTLNDPQSPFYVLAALSIPEASLRELDRSVTAIKRRLVPYAKPEDFEIKGIDLRQGRKLFKPYEWPDRIVAMKEIAQEIRRLSLPCLAVSVDTRDLPDHITTTPQVNRMALWRLLDEAEQRLRKGQEQGLLIIDSQSTGHSSIQDRRTIDAYRDWVASRNDDTRFVEQPFFGFSAFYAGLQLADFVAYLVSATEPYRRSDQILEGRHIELMDVYEILQTTVEVIAVP